MKRYLFLVLAASALASCSQNSNELILEDRVVSIDNEGSGKELMELVFDITEEGSNHCYQDTLFSRAFSKNIFEDEMHVIKEVIQLPDAAFPGEFLDSVIVTKANHGSFRKMLIFGNYKEGALFEVTRVQLLFNIIIDGMDLGDMASVNIDPGALKSETGFIQKANKIIANENLPIRNRHEWMKFKDIGNMDGMGDPKAQ